MATHCCILWGSKSLVCRNKEEAVQPVVSCGNIVKWSLGTSFNLSEPRYTHLYNRDSIHHLEFLIFMMIK